jgi:hypothetical protein
MMWCVCSRKERRFLSLRLMDSWELNSCRCHVDVFRS